MSRHDIEFPPKHAVLRDDVHMLGALVGEVLRDQGGAELFETVERDRMLAIARRSGDASAEAELERRVAGREPALARDLERAFSSWFQAVNLAEQVHRIRRRRAYFQDDAERPQPGGVDDAIGRLKAQGLTLDDVMGLLRTLHIMPVFMSHPTESTRRTILRKQLKLAGLLYDRLNPTLAPSERRASAGQIRVELTTHWQTEDHPRQRLTVADEREHVLFFLAEVLYRIVPGFYEEIAEALGKHYGVDLRSVDIPTILRFGSWVGGDMDGNPDVHAKSLRDTLARQQQTIVNAYFLEVQALAQVLSQSASRVGISAALQKRSDEYATLIPSARSSAPTRHDRMPYRVFLSQVAERLRATYDGRPSGYEGPAQLQRDIDLVVESLLAHRGQHAGLFAVRRLQRRIATFGFHLATLEVRQHSGVHHGILARALDEPAWTTLDRQTRHSRLVDLIARDRGPRVELDAEGKRALAVFEAILQCRRRYGTDAIGAYIVNGAEGTDDVLAALLLARWADVFDKHTNEIALDFAPMFATPEALERSGEIMRDLLNEPLYRAHLDARGRQQTALVGYSEANKREGLVASRFAVYRAQGAIAASLEAAGEEHRLVHARGGSIPRGGGRIDGLVTSAPPSTINGWLKLTEQGEGIIKHYGLGPIALRTLERAFGALSIANAAARAGRASEPDAQSLKIAESMARASASTYRSLVDDSSEFHQWFREVTPIDVIERMQIGGRPIEREGLQGLAALRAVPWVFAWTQNRMLLPGWYGAGSGLRAAIDEHGLVALKQAVEAWPFLRALIDDAEIMLARADLNIAAKYDALRVGSGDRFFAEVCREHQLTRELLLQVKDQQNLLDGDRTQQRALALRNPYVDPMNLMQVDLLRRWREGERHDRDLLEALLASVNGIAQGLQDTG
ncbi:MAG: phosphoenolpyruvate carboxylase [Gammaproteobacteria bacterium]